MKKILLIAIGILIPVSVFAYVSPGKPAGFVTDFAGVLSVQEEQDIQGKLVALRRDTGIEIAVVTVVSLGGDTVEEYAPKLFKEWGIGSSEKDTGVLVLVAPNEREVKIETGYGAEGFLTDIQSGNIIQTQMLPAFKEGKYATGILASVDALSAIAVNSPEAAQYSVPGQSDSSAGSNFDFRWGFFLVIILANIFAKILGATKSWWLGGVFGAVAGAIIGLIWGFLYIGTVSIVVLTVVGLIFDFIVSKRPPGSGRGGGIWPIFFGGGSSGGGFGGFGGGMSGGGGASGRW